MGIEDMRKSLFVVALALIVLVVGIELGSGVILNAAKSTGATVESKTPGMGIRYLALVDGLLLLALVMVGSGMVLNRGALAKVQGIGIFIFSLLFLLACIALIFVAFTLLMLMVGLLMAVPFGTIIYMAKWGFFPKGAAAVTLSFIMTLKLISAGCLVFAHQRFLKMKALILLFVTAIVATFLISFLHAFVPVPLVAILDALGALIVGVLGAIWAVVFLIGSIPAVIKALRLDRQFSGA